MLKLTSLLEMLTIRLSTRIIVGGKQPRQGLYASEVGLRLIGTATSWSLKPVRCMKAAGSVGSYWARLH